MSALSIPPVDQIKAGRYELTVEHWDEIVSKPGEPFDFVRHRKGEVVSLNAEDARRLVRGGAAVEPGAVQRAALATAKAQLEAAQAAFDLAHNTEVLATQAAEDVTPVTPAPAPAPAPTPAPAPATPPPAPDGAADPSELLGLSIAKITAAVGQNVELATQLLALEKAKGDDARGTLVEKLQAIATPAGE